MLRPHIILQVWHDETICYPPSLAFWDNQLSSKPGILRPYIWQAWHFETTCYLPSLAWYHFLSCKLANVRPQIILRAWHLRPPIILRACHCETTYYLPRLASWDHLLSSEFVMHFRFYGWRDTAILNNTCLASFGSSVFSNSHSITNKWNEILITWHGQ